MQDWFRRQRVTLLEWHSQYPDFKIIKPLWGSRKNADTTEKNTDEKFDQLAAEWISISQSTINTLDSMPRKFQAVIDVKSFPTKYYAPLILLVNSSS